MTRVSDSQLEWEIKRAIQHISTTSFPVEEPLQLREAFSMEPEGQFFVAMSWQNHYLLVGMLVLSPEPLYTAFFPDLRTQILLTKLAMDKALELYNSHKDWRFRGV